VIGVLQSLHRRASAASIVERLQYVCCKIDHAVTIAPLATAPWASRRGWPGNPLERCHSAQDRACAPPTVRVGVVLGVLVASGGGCAVSLPIVIEPALGLHYPDDSANDGQQYPEPGET
jgi:hypothetical protein